VSEYRESLEPKYRRIYDGASVHTEIGRAVLSGEASDDPQVRRLAEAVRSLWVMVARAEDVSVFWMKEADRAGGHYIWKDQHGEVQVVGDYDDDLAERTAEREAK